jgi:ureidoglycolate dehydrogenase (NAD+)
MEEKVVSVRELTEQCVKHLMKAGMPDEDARIATDVMIHANLRGVDSHGVARMEYYDAIFAHGDINFHPQIKIKQTGMVTATVDGDDGLGLVVSYSAAKKAIEMAKDKGVGMVGVFNSSHCGAQSYYLKMAAEEKLISIAMSNAGSAVIPFGGKQPFFGTNPVAFGFPARRHPPILLDMATSVVAGGKIVHDYLHRGKSIPIGWAVDEEGNDVTDPKLAKWLLHFAGPKGFGLAMVADIFSGMLSGGAFGPHLIVNEKQTLGQFLCFIDPAYFSDRDEFLDKIDQMIDEIHAIPPASGFERVMVPGEPEQLREVHHSQYGISLPMNIYEMFFESQTTK